MTPRHPTWLLRTAALLLAAAGLHSPGASAQSGERADIGGPDSVTPALLVGAGGLAGVMLGVLLGRRTRGRRPNTPFAPAGAADVAVSPALDAGDASPPAPWKDFVELSADWPWEIDADLRFVAIPDAPPPPDLALPDAVGRRWEDVVLSALSPEAAVAHRAALERREPMVVTLTHRGTSGEPRHLEMHGRPMRSATGRFEGYRGIGRDVTQHIHLAAELERCRALVVCNGGGTPDDITGKIVADSRRQQEDEALFRAIFHCAPACIGRFSDNGRWLQVNEALATFLGEPAAALAGAPIDAAMDADDAAAGKALRTHCLSGGIKRYSRDARWRGAKDGVRWCRESVRLLPGDDGRPPSFIAVVTDISENRAALDEQQARAARYRQLFELSPEATLVCVDGRVHLANAASHRLFAAGTPRVLEGLEMLALIHPDDRAMESARLQQFAAGDEQGSLAPLPLRYRRLDGETINAEATGVGMRFDGRPALLYVLRDVARWLSAEQVLRESLAMYRDVVESVNEILFQTDADGRLSFLNRAWRNTTGFDGRLSIGQRLLDFVVEDDRSRVEQGLRGIHEGYDAIAQFEFRLRTHTEGPRWVEATIRPLRDSYDHVAGCSGTLDDITARKEAEQTQRNLNRELEARVRVRTAELEASNRELEAFSYSVSHDLRAPLRAIDGFSQIIAEDYAPRLDDTGREYLQRIRVATQKMARLIDDLIDLARLTRQTMTREQVDLSQIVEQILAELHQEDPNRQIDIHVEPGLIAAADRALIRVALENLLRNAWKFTSRREVAQIRFHAEQRNRQIVYCVTDNGAGFDMNFASKLFLPFHRLHGISDFAGTGIGLATVQRVIQRHEGRVWAQSTPDSGASFFFTLSH